MKDKPAVCPTVPLWLCQSCNSKCMCKHYRVSVTTVTEADIWAKTRKTNFSAKYCWPTATSLFPSHILQSVFKDLL